MPAQTSLAGPSSSNGTSYQPNASLYIKNLNTKTKKPELRRQLYSLFSTYGKVIDIVATRAEGMRGQAFVVFGNLRSATAARRALDGFEFYERSIRIDYASKPSKASIVHEHGPEALFDPAIMQAAGLALANVTSSGKVTTSSAQADQQGRERKRAREEARQRGDQVDEEETEEEDEDEDDAQPEAKIRKIEHVVTDGDGETKKAASTAEATAVPDMITPTPMAKQEVDNDDDEEETAMDMEDSDDDGA